MATEKRGRRGGVMLPSLQRIRLERGYTVRGLAEAAGVNPATVTAIEQGHRGAQGSTLRKMAKALGVETSDLVGTQVPEARRADPMELAMALAARGAADLSGRDPRAVYADLAKGTLTVEDILGGAGGRRGDDPFERARLAASSYVGLAEVDRSGERLADGEGASDEISEQRAGRLRV